VLEYLDLAHMHKSEVVGVEEAKFLVNRLWLWGDWTHPGRVQSSSAVRHSLGLAIVAAACPIVA